MAALMPPGLGDGNDEEEEAFNLMSDAPPGVESDEPIRDEQIDDDPGTPLEHERSPFHDLEQQALEQANGNGAGILDEEADAEVDAEAEVDEDEDSSDSDSDVVVKIGDIKANVPFHTAPKPAQAVGVSAGKLDMDQTATIDGQPIYDLDLAQMEDKPWRKPGADITDYFNYGFTEETWNMYCERQKKLRAEFGSQAAANKALFSSINLANPSAPIMQSNNAFAASRPQNVTVLGSYPTSTNLTQGAQVQNQQPTKIVVNLSEKFRNPPPTVGDQANKIGSPMFRTVLTPGQPPRQTTIPTAQSMSVPPPNIQVVSQQQQQTQSTPTQQQPQQVSTITRLGGAAAPTIIMSSGNSNTAPIVSFSSSSGPISLDQPPPSGQDFGDYSQPPPSTPDYSHPPPVMKQEDFGANKDYSQPPPSGGGGGGGDGPPGVDELAPPGSTPPPGITTSSQPPPTMQINDPAAGQVRQITTLGAPPINMSVPPPRFNPNLPPPGMGPPGVGTIPTVRLGLPPTNMPPPPFGHLLPPGVGVPPPGYRFPPTNIRPPPMMGRAGFGGIPQHQPPHMQEGERSPASYSDKSSDLDDGDYRHKPSSSQSRSGGRYAGGGGPPMRRRSRSRSPPFSPSTRGSSGSRSRRSDERDRDSSRKRSRHRSRSRSPSPHESSRSSSRRKDDDKKKRKDDDDKDRKKRRRKSDDESEKKDDSSRKKRSRKDD
uniref:Pre-mRNA 3'-end-processing factor FIP1 n=1 Tax=Plectus sambesii TaxID=2011161 RepID=A0A914V6S0_9BILA